MRIEFREVDFLNVLWLVKIIFNKALLMRKLNHFKSVNFILIIVISSLNLLAQNNYPTRDSIHIFWQPNVKITYQDFQQKLPKNILESMDSFKFDVSASVGILMALDVPKRRKGMSDKFEKIYFAPAFERTTSGTRTSDSLQIAMQLAYLDIAEIWARWGREQFSLLKDSTNVVGIQTLAYSTIVSAMMEKYISMRDSYSYEVLIKKKEGAFIKWRNGIDEMLLEKTKWTTSREECYRMIKGKPIEPGYKNLK